MKKVAFFDLKEEELSIYLFEKNGGTYMIKDTINTPVKEKDLFSIDRTFDGIEESYLSLPLSLLNFRTLELPFSNMSKVKEILPFELDGLILVSPEAAVFDACVLGESNGKYKVLAVYVMKDALRKILEKLKVLKIDPKFVTSIELSSLLGSFASYKEITPLLINPKPIDSEDRINGAIKEIDRPTINLRVGELSYTVDTEKTKKSIKLAATLFVLLLLVFLSDMALNIISTKRAISSVRDDMRKTYAGIFPQEKKITNELYQIKAHLKELKEKERSFIGVSPLQLLLDLSQVSKQGMSFHEITMDKERIILKGECPSLSDVQQIKSSLEKFLTQVTITDAKPSSQNRTLFTITAKERKP
ncbi:MAG: hypothetical protein OEZ31_03635 [Nitrospirota bacterium]|nr:hypothetical protein [Nitrospirota bacterium]MDH5768033.1 hypothetical protein [Nitrospirota bacterium]